MMMNVVCVSGEIVSKWVSIVTNGPRLGEVGGEVTWSRTTHELSNFVDVGVLGGSPHGAAEGRVLGAFEPQSDSVPIRRVGAASMVSRPPIFP